MMPAEAIVFDLRRRLACELVGTAALVAAVVGSGIMATRLTEDVALALLANTVATGAALVVLVTLLAPISGAHLNPVVSLVMVLRRTMSPREAALYTAAQCAGGVLGTMLAHAMFGLPLLVLSTRLRSGGGQWLSEAVAAFVLVATILLGARFRPAALPWLVGLVITSAYWFTASTSFANPAVALARAFTDSFSGIRLQDVPAFAFAECAGGGTAAFVISWLLRPQPEPLPSSPAELTT